MKPLHFKFRNVPRIKRPVFVIFAVCTLALSGCAVFKTGKNKGYQFEASPEQEALMQQNQQQLNTAASRLQANNPNEAKRLIDRIDPRSLLPPDLARWHLLQAQVNLSLAETAQAIKHLRLIQASFLTPEDKASYFRSRAVIFSLIGKPIESAKARIALQPFLSDADQLAENKSAILETLRLLSVHALQAQQPQAANELGGWMALARLIKLSPRIEDTDAKLLQWRAHFPEHPADPEFLTAYLTASRKTPAAIAVLLPESGAYAQAATAIKAGFMAAYAQNDASAAKPELRFYDSAASDPVALYQQAVSEGAQLVIGPLNKEHVEQLAKVDALEIPVLTLNHIPGLDKANLYQFALSPIDEVEQITNKAVDDGYKKIALLTPKTELGERIQVYFQTALQKRGGTLLKAKYYNPDDSDYSTTLKNLLDLSDSEKRAMQQKRFIADEPSSPAKELEVEAIFITAYPQDAKTIQAQLHTLPSTRNIPIYATPQVYNGISSTKDSDLNDITFCDIPWVFKAAYQGNLSQEALRSTWQPFPTIYLRLMAMGIDAYNLIPHLEQLEQVPYYGATGKLLLADKHRIQRHLVCAKFNHSKPTLIDSYVQSNAKNQANTPAVPANNTVSPARDPDQ